MNWRGRPIGFLESCSYSPPGWWITCRERLGPYVINQGVDHLPSKLTCQLRICIGKLCIPSLGPHGTTPLSAHLPHDIGACRT